VNQDYLWDRTGSDTTVERLEALLSPLALPPSAAPRRESARRRFPLAAPFAAAAILVVTILGVKGPVDSSTPSARTIDLGRFGEVVVEPDAILRTVRRSDDEIRLRLERGTIHASITWEARPRLFQVETPATTCVDLGCHYTLTVDARGRTTVHVETGRVAFEDRGREVFVPAGATCRAEPGAGSGTPWWDDAPGSLIAAIGAFDAAPRGRRAAAALNLARNCARKADSLTLWHLLQDGDRGVREAGFTALAALVGVPEGVTREATLARDPGALEEWKRHAGESWGE